MNELSKIEKRYDHLAQLATSNIADTVELNELLNRRIAIKKGLKAAFKSPFGSTFRTDLTKVLVQTQKWNS